MRAERRMKSPCGQKCRLKCSTKIDEETRRTIFDSYWDLGELSKQRQFVANSITPIEPSYRYVRIGGKRQPRSLNNAFHFYISMASYLLL